MILLNNYYILVFIGAPDLTGDILITNVSAAGDFDAPAINATVAEGIQIAFNVGLELENIEALDNGRVQYTFYCYKQCNSGCYNQCNSGCYNNSCRPRC